MALDCHPEGQNEFDIQKMHQVTSNDTEQHYELAVEQPPTSSKLSEVSDDRAIHYCTASSIFC